MKACFVKPGDGSQNLWIGRIKHLRGPRQQDVFPVLIPAAWKSKLAQPGGNVTIRFGARLDGLQHRPFIGSVQSRPVGHVLWLVEEPRHADGFAQTGQGPQVVAGPISIDQLVVIMNRILQQAVRIGVVLVADIAHPPLQARVNRRGITCVPGHQDMVGHCHQHLALRSKFPCARSQG